MSNICRDGDLGTTGHLCDAVAGVVTTQGKVFANGTPVARLGDPALPHTILIADDCVGHLGAVINMGSSTVFAKGIPVARTGDSFDLGAMLPASQNVFAGG